jgi:APA family basic amino acid/polyamine antiporter
MADAGSLPPWFRERNDEGAPVRSVVFCGVMTTLLTSMAYTRAGIAAYNFAALLSAATGLLLYGISAAAVFRFMRDGRVPRSRALLVAGGGALLFSVWALYGSGWEAIGWGTLMTAAGWPIYRFATRTAATESAARS